MLHSPIAGCSGAGLRRLQETPRFKLREYGLLSEWAGIAWYGEGHGKPADVPDEPREVPRNGDHADVHILATRCELAIS